MVTNTHCIVTAFSSWLWSEKRRNWPWNVRTVSANNGASYRRRLWPRTRTTPSERLWTACTWLRTQTKTWSHCLSVSSLLVIRYRCHSYLLYSKYNCFRRIFSCCWRESTRPLQLFCKSLLVYLLLDPRKLILWMKIRRSNNIVPKTLSGVNYYGLLATCIDVSDMSENIIKQTMWNVFSHTVAAD